MDGANASNMAPLAPDCNVSESNTCLETVHVLHKWKIENFSIHTELSQVGDSLSSTVFGSQDNQYKFMLRLYPIGKDEECRGYVSLFLQIRECPSPKARFRVNFFVDTQDGPRGCALNRNIVTINKGGIVTASRFFSVEFLKQRNQRFLPEDSLVVGCELFIFGDTVSQMKKAENVPIPKSTLSDDLGTLLVRDRYTDFTMEVADKVFKVHKAVVGARSAVFEAMFTNEMVEASKNSAKITDISPEAFQALLEYMYTDDTNAVKTIPEEVLVAADKYGLERLRAQCEAVLCEDLNVQNVCFRLKMADMYGASILKGRALTVVRENSAEVLSSEGWLALESECPRLAASILKDALIAIEPPAKRARAQ